MRDPSSIRERFMRDGTPVRLGGIAANLSRISSFYDDPGHKQAILGIIEESKWFIEWAAPSLEIDVAARLAEIQVSLAMLESRLHNGRDAGDLIDRVPGWSEEILNMSGLLDQ